MGDREHGLRDPLDLSREGLTPPGLETERHNACHTTPRIVTPGQGDALFPGTSHKSQQITLAFAKLHVSRGCPWATDSRHQSGTRGNQISPARPDKNTATGPATVTQAMANDGRPHH